MCVYYRIQVVAQSVVEEEQEGSGGIIRFSIGIIGGID